MNTPNPTATSRPGADVPGAKDASTGLRWFAKALARLEAHASLRAAVTKLVPSGLSEPGQIDARWAERIGALSAQLAENDGLDEDAWIDAFVDYSKSALTSASAGSRLTPGARTVFSQALWRRRHQALSFFKTSFSNHAPIRGAVLEAPTRTGFYLSEFLHSHASWEGMAIGADAASVAMATRVIALNSSVQATVDSPDVTLLPADARFDRIICSEWSPSIANFDRTLAGLAARLAPGGRLFLRVEQGSPSIHERLATQFRIEHETRCDEGLGSAATPTGDYACVLARR